MWRKTLKMFKRIICSHLLSPRGRNQLVKVDVSLMVRFSLFRRLETLSSVFMNGVNELMPKFDSSAQC